MGKRVYSIRTLLMIVIGVIVVVSTSVVWLMNYNKSLSAMETMQEASIERTLKEDIKTIKERVTREFGSLSVEGGKVLDEKGVDIREYTDLTKELEEEWNIKATVFGYIDGEFRREISVVGAKNIGTNLTADNPAREKLKNKEEFIGFVDINGGEYLYYYTPIIQDGELVGAISTGVSKEWSEELIKGYKKEIQTSGVFIYI